MWYLVPNSSSSTPAAEEESSERRLLALSEELARSATWNTKSLPAKSWQRVLRTVPFMKRRSGLISTPSMAGPGVDAWVASLAVIPASLLASPESASASRTRATSTLAYQQSFEMLIQDGSSSRTCQGMCASDCERCGAIFKSWVSRFTLASTRRRKWARLTRDSVSSSWPSARGHESGSWQRDGKTGELRPTLDGAATQWQTVGTDSFRSRGGDRKDEMGLDQQARTWRTPEAPGQTGGVRSRTLSRGQGHQVTTAEQWPTPLTPSTPEAHGQLSGDFRKKLDKVWPTARAEDAESAGNHHGATDSLSGAIAAWATPAARSVKGGYSEAALTRADGKSRMDILDNQAIYLFQPSLLDQESETPGEPSSNAGPTSRRLSLGLLLGPVWKLMYDVRSDLWSRLAVRGQLEEELPADWHPSLLRLLSQRRQLNPRFAEWLMGWRPGHTSLVHWCDE